ncbi:uncharacterized protein LOC131683120 [Topomyia yanbarensis]|uniref:uncharacterized protein LOC131683120 n=1 Tax=Topomyia yanbarensis TaxID=2498891 RepID=UPI00273C9885|nr:uncharacterized protein LOC131683120 [Topomyia yanbarensis]
MLSLLVDIFKAYRKCVKHMQVKEEAFAKALVDAYKIFIQHKTTLPDNANLLELAVKLCTYEINYRKTMDKLSGINKTTSSGADTAATIITPMRPISTVNCLSCQRAEMSTIIFSSKRESRMVVYLTGYF